MATLPEVSILPIPNRRGCCTSRQNPPSDEVKELRREAGALKEVVAELTLENRLLKKSVTADGEVAA